MKAMSPDGEAIVTGAGDETLRFWNLFSKTRSTKVQKWSFFHISVQYTLHSNLLLKLQYVSMFYFLVVL